MAHADGWMEAYDLLVENKVLPGELQEIVTKNRNGLGETMLHWYAIEGDTKVVEKIIDLGLDVNTQNKFLQTPLFECVSIERWDMVKLLLDSGADIGIKNQNDETIWQYLEFNDETEKINRLKDLTSS